MGKYCRSITHATETSHDALTIRYCLFASIMNNGSLWSRQMDTRAQAGVGGGRGYGIFSLKKVSNFTI